ncbi:MULTISPECIES: AAA family ATPase [unclassified Streptomyces]|uniref:helix-turn-helix transcriptional regulator n=1 Tax=unclassified Streptomyces TaxID=2593676 RepID=UPI0036E963D6
MKLAQQEKELDELEAALTASLNDTGQIVFIEGPCGCGKSELMDTFAEQAAARGAVILSTVGSESDGDAPFSTLRRLSSNEPSLVLPLVSEGAGILGTEALRGVWSAVLDRNRDTPLVCLVDDLHYADAASLESLKHLVRLSRTARVLIVLSQTTPLGLLDPAFSTELLRMRNVRHIRLSRLDSEQVTSVVSRYPDLAATSADHAAELNRVSGGNPLLLRALIAERLNSAADVPANGGPYAQAVLTCARRSSRSGLRLAGAVAVLGSHASPKRLAELLGITTTAAAQGLAALVTSGVVDGKTFRHPVGRTAILDNLPRHELIALHRRTAEILYAAGAPPHLVAQHLVVSSADGLDEPEPQWATEVLCATAEHVLIHDDTEQAVRLLERAHAACPDTLRRGEIKTRLAAIAWRIDPALSERCLDEAFETLRTADATPQSVWPLAQILVAQGRITDATELRNRTMAGTDANSLSANHTPWARTVADPFARHDADEDTPRLTATADSHQYAAIGADTTDIERFLESTALAGPTLPPIIQAVTALAHSDDPRRAVHWSRVLLEKATRLRAVGWQCAFTSIHAAALWRLGDLREAERFALQALELVPNRRNCTFAHNAVATLILARTEMRDFAAAAAYVDQPLPPKLFQTTHGLSYLRARGRYLAATNQLHAALDDFFEIGRLMKRWNIDWPVLLPWRTEAAEVLRRLGESQAVERLVLQQLSTPGARHPAVRGITLRLRAATSESKKRSPLLQQAVSELRRSGERVELARTLAELAEAMHAVGDPMAEMTSQQAISLASECEANALLEEIRRNSPPSRCFEPDAAGTAGAADAIHARLSESERRVAALAALKYSNREISKLLHVTISTVEQHLTNVYRKLDINGRRHLPANIDLYAMDIACV